MFFRCVAESVMENGVKGLAGMVPGGPFAYAVAEGAFKKYKERKQAAKLSDDIARMAQVTFDEARAEAVQAVREILAVAPTQPNPTAAPTPEEALDLELYLTAIPEATRQSLKRPDDPAGTSVPASFALNSADDVLKLLPARSPRFRTGMALPGKAGWVLERLLGIGGFGEVWFTRHSRMTSLSGAVKFCLGQSGKDLIHEADLIDRVMSAGKHPNIVPLLDVGLEGDTPWLLFEYVGGGSLTDWIHKLAGRPPEIRLKQVMAAMRQLTDAVSFFHRLNPPIVHRDLKPSNILLDRSSSLLRVTDFGIGSVTARETLRQERHGQSSRGGRLLTYMRGSHTPLYSSPQQRNSGDPDPRDDVHALGVIAYQMLTGHLAQGAGPDFADDLRDAGASDDLIALLGRCVAQKAERRHGTAAELADAFARLGQAGPPPVPVAAPPPPPFRTTPTVAPPEVARSAGPTDQALTRLQSGEVTLEDLLLLRQSPRGAAALTLQAERVWPHIRDAALADPRFRVTFKDWLTKPERLQAFIRDGCEALVQGEFDAWDARWAVVRDVATPDQLKTLVGVAGQRLENNLPTLAIPARERLRAASAESGAWPDHHLLTPSSLEELGNLLNAKRPENWQGYTCFAVMGPNGRNGLIDETPADHSAMRMRVRQHLMLAPSSVLVSYIKHAKEYLKTMPGFLYDLFLPFRPECVPLMSRLIDVGADIIDASVWVKLIGDLDLYGQSTPEWEGFLLKDDHLAKLLGGFKADPAATPVWEGYVGLLGPELITGDEWERAVYTQLTKARGLLTEAGVMLMKVVPAACVRKLAAADTLLALMANPATGNSLEPGVLCEAFRYFDIDPVDGLRSLYQQNNFDKFDLNAEPRRLAPFTAAFMACFPITHEYHTVRTAVTSWIVLSVSCPEAMRAAFQMYFIRECVPRNWYRGILNEAPRVVLHPVAEALVRKLVKA